MYLREILAEIDNREVLGEGDPAIDAIIYDSRQAKAGSLFIAIPGFKVNGRDFAPAAVKAGAAAVIAEEAVTALAVPQVIVADARRALAQAAAAFYGYPGRELAVIGVTGTKGKTTVSFILDAILRAAGRKTALFSTVKVNVGGVEYPARLTTAEAPELQGRLREAVNAGVSYAVMEVSSHALALKRVASIPLRAAVFTNLSHDHLDLHGDMAAYFAAKEGLFAAVLPGGLAAVNGDDEWAPRARVPAGVRRITFGRESGNDYRARDIRSDWKGVAFTLEFAGGRALELVSSLAGEFNVMNILAAAATASALGIEDDAVKKGVAALTTVPGRLELYELSDRLWVVIDYAHSPASFEAVLAEIARLPAQRRIVVFGCTGERDREKRPLMGELAARAADVVIVTTDDPYDDDPAAIADEVAAGVRRVPGAVYEIILDRGAAVRRALEIAAGSDAAAVVALLGKGHEKVQKAGGREIPCDDRELTARAARACGLQPPAALGF